ncbi:MAG: hypothetical protein EAZ53_01240 [Bacteroidetes bacterium]|nr:MAG: hypothetical protein EAZ53_01240 [Bacteroidota bacterium]
MVIPPGELQQVINKLQEIASILKPFLIALTPDERKSIPKMSDKTQPFVEKALDYAQSNPEFTPAYMSVPELQIDMKAVQDLTAVLQLLQPMCDNVNDTTMLSGSEAYLAALTYYNSVKHAAKSNIPSAKAIYDDLSKRFEAQKAKGKKQD